MARLSILLIAAASLWSAPAAADPLERWSAYVEEASGRFGVPQEWIRRVIRAESGGRLTLGGRPIVSRAGAMGLMQLMPGTWSEMRALLGLGGDPHDPRDNILAGTAYLRMMYDRFGYPGLFAAYNAGPGRYQDHLSRGRPLPGETVAYVSSVAGGRARGAGAARASPPRDRLFAIRADSGPVRAAGPGGPEAAAGPLFAALGPGPR